MRTEGEPRAAPGGAGSRAKPGKHGRSCAQVAHSYRTDSKAGSRTRRDVLSACSETLTRGLVLSYDRPSLPRTSPAAGPVQPAPDPTRARSAPILRTHSPVMRTQHSMCGPSPDVCEQGALIDRGRPSHMSQRSELWAPAPTMRESHCVDLIEVPPTIAPDRDWKGSREPRVLPAIVASLHPALPLGTQLRPEGSAADAAWLNSKKAASPNGLPPLVVVKMRAPDFPSQFPGSVGLCSLGAPRPEPMIVPWRL